ncbi:MULTISPECIES: ABC transporter ATP-binding protein [Halorussus]|uniref:ABC transporter ATP-binding protein n=1 Tax=Halorussus TaxID=1070314 RepID=UPI0020A17AD7|nr:ABC transporter ATP-binding protein [Halorussus vallis]USZ74250.1 ABC transporter ATP-binding protein [Halorussus vallis]
MPSIETHGLTKHYGDDVTAVDNLGLTVEPGEVFGFLGPNGAGKSTTINMLLDFVRPTSGEITVLGYDPRTDPRAVRERTGVLPEATGFYEQDTARDHLRFATAMKRTNDDPDALLERVGIADAADRPVGGFSKGMRQRLGLAIALVGSPELLVLDEPLGGLDPSGARLLREVVREERDRGAAVFFSSHIMDQVETVCDRVGIMHDGHLVAVDTIESLHASSEMPTTVSLSVEMTPEGITDELTALSGVSDATIRNGSVLVECADPRAKADAIARLDEEGVPLLDINTEASSLEEVFLAITDGSETKDVSNV